MAMLMQSPHDAAPQQSAAAKVKACMLIRSHLIAIAIAAVAASSMANSASGEKKYDVGASDAEIKLGNIVPYSGPASAFGSVGKVQAGFLE
jgi:hypothetical protein